MTARPCSVLPGLALPLAILFSLGAASRKEAVYLQKTASAHTQAEFLRTTGGRVRIRREARCATSDGAVLVGSPRGIVRRTADGRVEPFPSDRLLPFSHVTVIVEPSPRVAWIGTTRGLVRYDRRGPEPSLEYFAGRRWMPDDRVTGIGVEGAGAIWIETAKGLGRIEYRPMTLAEKARAFEARVRARHVRHGLTASSRLKAPGDLATSRPYSNDNDGLWTSIYVAAECFRYKVTGEGEARAFARQGLEALMRLEAITGIAGFPARSFIELGVEEQPADGVWYTTPDGRWRWKGDTSSDELVGHFFAYSIYYDLVADEPERAAIRAVVGRIMSHILDHDYRVVGPDGPTRWGFWGPQQIWQALGDTGLLALGGLSGLRTAHHVTGDARFLSAYQDLATTQQYAQLTRFEKVNVPGYVNHSDDELAFLLFYPLLLYETDASVKAIYVHSLQRAWLVERVEANPLWDFIAAVGSGAKDFDAKPAVQTLQRIPMDLVTWTMANSDRRDLIRDPNPDRFGQRQALLPVPVDERAVTKWNANPYRLDDGDGGITEDDGAYFLLPYWMGRYHGLVEE